MKAADNDRSHTIHADQRERFLLERMRQRGRIEAAEVATELRVTGETIRKDLIHLERQGLVRRVHAGAVPTTYLTPEPTAERTRIAAAALDHIPHHGSVLIDAGSVTAQLVDMFPTDRELTVYTNTLSMALRLLTRPLLTVFSLGGRVRSTTGAEVDDWAARALAEIAVDVAFLSADGIHASRGLTTPDPAEAAVKRRMLRCAQRRIILADHSKIGRVRAIQFGDITDADLLITDTGLPDAHVDALQEAGLTTQRA